jgi:hypothetical protein
VQASVGKQAVASEHHVHGRDRADNDVCEVADRDEVGAGGDLPAFRYCLGFDLIDCLRVGSGVLVAVHRCALLDLRRCAECK